MQVLFMRHAQTNYNILGLCNDDPARDVHLTEQGIAQATAAAQRLRDAPLERIVVSELPRTRQTAEIVNRHHGVAITVHPAINDLRSGFDGRPVAEYFAAAGDDRLHFAPPGGESLIEHKRRVLGYLDWLKTLRESTVLTVAHEETMRVFAAHFRRLNDAQMMQVNAANCEIYTFTL